ncbi:MAG: DNA-protecting protein DprA [Bacteroidales bacterium]|nr:DNA-protecting protein DprA [Bacteroidales bacterium]
MDSIKEKACLCALNRIFGFEPQIGHALLAHFEAAENIFELSRKDIDLVLGPHSGYRERISWKQVEKEHDELERLSKRSIRFTGCSEEGYPGMLRDCPDAPIGLYIRSTTPDHDLWSRRHTVSVVGTRDLSSYGREWCTRIIRSLASSPDKPLIISGLAIGTDICAHRTAIDNGLPTIAVMATGPESIYPIRHTDFAERLSCTPGCALVTDYPPGTAPLPLHFLRRNRIIAGLSEATLLVESKIKGGGMMTANLAFSYGREVYAIPGRIDDICSQGCNRLIRGKVAEAVTGDDEFLKSLGMTAGKKKNMVTDKEKIASIYGRDMTPDRLELMTKSLIMIRKCRGITIEELSGSIGVDYSTAAKLTGLLESDGLISIDLLQRCCINISK